LTKILRAEITGLAGTKRSHDFTFDPSLNVFWGLNGSGKTSFLRILQSALANDASSISDVAFESARVVFLSEELNAVLERTLIQDITVMRSPKTGNKRSSGSRDGRVHEHYEIPGHLEENGDGWRTAVLEGDDIPYPGAYMHSYLPISRLMDYADRRWSRYDGADYERRPYNFENEIEAAWRQYNSVSLEGIRRIQQKGLADILSVLFQSSASPVHEPVESTIDENEAHRLVVEFLVQQGMALDLDRQAFIRRYRHQRELQQVVHRISDVNAEIERTTRSQRAFQSIIGELYSGDKQIVFSNYSTIEVRMGRRSLSVDGLSSGEKQLLRILLTTLAGETSPVLVDEPELSMHIDWQRSIVQSMRAVNPDCQLVLATHSPEVVARIPQHQMFEL
jgi:ABC-type cobalamin/Fe3+-siderophores transport system ATPase subunit